MINFTITAPKDTSFRTDAVGRVPGGYRLQVNYQKGIKFGGFDSKGARVAGSVLAGSDWVLLQDNGVAAFDARITFEANVPGDHVFDAVLSGQVGLQSLGFSGPINTEGDWKKLTGTLNVTLPIQFETANKDLPAGLTVSTVFSDAAKYSEVFADLSRNQFVATGSIKVTNGELESATLEVLSAEDAKARHDALQVELKDLSAKHDQLVKAGAGQVQARAASKPGKPSQPDTAASDSFWNLLLKATAETWPMVHHALQMRKVTSHLDDVLARLHVASPRTERLRSVEEWESAKAIIDELESQIGRLPPALTGE